MKRFVSIVLCLAMIVGMMTGFSGCGKTDSDGLLNAEWISMINQYFGMEYYTSEAPYYKNVDKNSPYYEDAQIACEWGVLPIDEYVPEDVATKEFVIVTLMNAGEFCDYSLSNEEKVQCAIDKGFIKDDVMLQLQLDDPIDRQEAEKMLSLVQTNWAEQTFDYVLEEVSFVEGVKNFSGQEESPILEYTVSGDKTYILASDDIVLEEGDIYILPPNEANMGIVSYKVSSVEKVGDYLVITNDEESVEIEDCIQELNVEETYVPDLLASGMILDGDGNIINLSTDEENEYTAIPLSYASTGGLSAETLGKGPSGKISIEKGAWTVEGIITSDCVKFEVKKKLNESMEAFGSVSISDFEITNDIDYSWGTLHSATSKVDYEVKISGGVEGEFYKNAYYRAPWHSNELDNFLLNVKNAFYSDWKDKNSPGTATINICSIPVASAGVITLNLDIKVKVSIDGTFEVEVTMDGCKGVQYKNGNLRYIKTNNVDVNVNLNAKAEITPSVGFNANIVGKAIIGFSADGGLGLKIETVLHLIDTENHLLATDSSSVPANIIEACVENGATTSVEAIQAYAEKQGATYSSIETGEIKLDVDLCFNIKIYPILRFGLNEETLAGKLLKGLKISLSYEAFGEKDAFVNLHIEKLSDLSSWDRIKACNNRECTKEFKPFEAVEEMTTETSVQETEEFESDEGIVDKEQLDISQYMAVLEIGEKTDVTVTKLPTGYSYSDITAYSENEAVATVSDKGVITAVGQGSTLIVIETIDGKYRITCAVTVTAEEKIEIEEWEFVQTF